MNTQTQLAQSPEATAEWWRGSVIYQIYPRSFQDSNNDGVGDLKGITDRMPYLASLGIDAVWISPFFTSPMKDFGYDVSDYRDVDPMFGKLEDFDALIAAAHRSGIRIIVDLVLSHTSDQHEWFKESRIDDSNDKADWYVWADPKPDGTPPTNWLSIFGGSAWQWEGRRRQYYLHNFLVSQPDMNFHNPEVRDALLDVTKFWLDRGVDGFRLDTVNFYFHDAELRDNPGLAPEDRNDTIAPGVNPYNHQEHLYDKNRPENLDFLRSFRALLDEYGAVAVGEVGDAQRGLEIMGEYTKGDDLLHMCYAFEFLAKDKPTATHIASVLARLDQVASEGWPCWAFSNHDVVRHATRWDMSDAQVRAMAMLIMCMRGSVCLYQGEELGLTEVDVAFDDLQDPYGIEFWPEFKGRDGCRTPMVWDGADPHGGFSETKPWLPVDASHLEKAVSVQDTDQGSLLNFYRRAVAFRQSNPVFAHGGQSPSRVDGTVLHFERTEGVVRVFCAFNLSEEPAEVALPEGAWRQLGDTIGTASIGGGSASLAPWQAVIAVRD